MSHFSEYINTLIEARELVRHSKHWCEVDLARDARGRSVDPFSEEAVSWCAVGAIYRVADDAELAEEILTALMDADFYFDTTNDAAGHLATLQMFDAAIEAADEAMEEGHLDFYAVSLTSGSGSLGPDIHDDISE